MTDQNQDPNAWLARLRTLLHEAPDDPETRAMGLTYTWTHLVQGDGVDSLPQLVPVPEPQLVQLLADSEALAQLREKKPTEEQPSKAERDLQAIQAIRDPAVRDRRPQEALAGPLREPMRELVAETQDSADAWEEARRAMEEFSHAVQPLRPLPNADTWLQAAGFRPVYDDDPVRGLEGPIAAAREIGNILGGGGPLRVFDMQVSAPESYEVGQVLEFTQWGERFRLQVERVEGDRIHGHVLGVERLDESA